MSSELENKFVSKSISKLYLKSEIADVFFTFNINGQQVKVPAHETILAAASPVFHAMFFGPMKENQIVKMVDVDEGAFKEFLQFFYLPNVTLSMENIEAVVRLTDKYDMIECLNSCVEFLEEKLTSENIIWGLQLAISMKSEKLKEFCTEHVQLLSSDYFNSEIFFRCTKETVKHILQLEAMCCGEAELFKACVEWAKASCQLNDLDENDPEKIKNELGECFYLTRFKAMTNEEIGTIMANKVYSKLFTSDEMRDVICMNSIENFEPEFFQNTMRLPLKWNDNNVLTCNLGSSSERYSVKSTESTRFSSNVPLLLGEIICRYIYDSSYNNNYASMNFKLSIVERAAIEANGEDKVIFTGTMECPAGAKGSVSLTRPIYINPKKMYEIHLEKQSSNTAYFNSYWKDENKLDGNIIIKFHPNPLNNLKERNLVSALKFNRIKL